jgi:hypothetical protein
MASVMRARQAENAANPMTGSGMQQAHVVCDGGTVEVVRNHEDGKRIG